MSSKRGQVGGKTNLTPLSSFHDPNKNGEISCLEVYEQHETMPNSDLFRVKGNNQKALGLQHHDSLHPHDMSSSSHAGEVEHYEDNEFDIGGGFGN